MNELSADLALADSEARASRARVTVDEVMRLAQTYTERAYVFVRNGNDDGIIPAADADSALRAAVEALVAERDALREALEQVTASLDALGDESDGDVSPYVWKKHKCRASIDAARAALNGGRP